MNATTIADAGFLTIKGRDALKFLQGYTTNDLDTLGSDGGLGAMCNLKGRMLTSFRIAAIEDGFMLRMHRPLVPKTIDFLSRYIVFSKAAMCDVSDDYVAVGIDSDVRPSADAFGKTILSAIGLDNLFEAWLPAAASSKVSIGHDETEWAFAEIAAGIAWVHEATTEAFLPQMFGYAEIGGISFDKGCYLGQEIVARMEYRGELKRHLRHATTAGHASVGDEITDGGKGAGSVVASARRDNCTHLLAVLRDDAGALTVHGESVDLT